MKKKLYEGVRFFDASNACIAEIRVHSGAASMVFHDDAVIIMIGDRLRKAGFPTEGKHMIWFGDDD